MCDVSSHTHLLGEEDKAVEGGRDLQVLVTISELGRAGRQVLRAEEARAKSASGANQETKEPEAPGEIGGPQDTPALGSF